MSDSQLTVETQIEIAASAHDVFEAIVDPERMAGYFISTGTGRLDGGVPVVWSWADCGAEATVTPEEIDPDRRICFRWGASGHDGETLVAFDLATADSGGCLVKVSEAGWPRDDEGIARTLQQMGGWMHMLCCLKARLEHGINLRARPDEQ